MLKYDRSDICHGLMQKAMNFNDVAIASIKGSYYRIHFHFIVIFAMVAMI